MIPVLGLAIPSWILIAAAVAGVGVLSWIIYRNTHKSEPVKPGHVAVLGPKESGKSLFLNWLKYNKFVEPDRTNGTIEFDFKFIHKGETYRIKGKDISGDESLIKRYYEDLISASNSVMLFFDGNIFIHNRDYRHDVCKRARFVNDHLYDDKVFAIVATHLDCYKPNWTSSTSIVKGMTSKADDAHDTITNLVKQEYPEVHSSFMSNMTTTNLKDEDSVKLLIKRLFEK